MWLLVASQIPQELIEYDWKGGKSEEKVGIWYSRPISPKLLKKEPLENSYDEEEDTGSITIRFKDTPPPTSDDLKTHITDTNNQDLYYTATPGDSLNNIGNIDPNSDHITIRITGVNDQVPNNSTINKDPVVEQSDDDDDDDIGDIEQTGVDHHNTKIIGVEDHKPNDNTEPEPKHDNNKPRKCN